MASIYSLASTTTTNSVINLTATNLSQSLGGVTFTITNADPMTLTTSVAMTGFVYADVYQMGAGSTMDSWLLAGSGAASSGARLHRGRSWNAVTVGNIGLSSTPYCCTVDGYLTGAGKVFSFSGGSANGTPNVTIALVG
jgi:hypothetical protein